MFALTCSICHSNYDYEEGGCPHCHHKKALEEMLKQVRGRVAAGLPTRCHVCKQQTHADGLCTMHHAEFVGAPEYARVRTAIADWHRRTTEEK